MDPCSVSFVLPLCFTTLEIFSQTKYLARFWPLRHSVGAVNFSRLGLFESELSQGISMEPF